MTASPTKRVYFDHSATSRVLPEVFEAMAPFYTERFGNASSLHSFGREAKASMEHARKHLAALINADPGEIVFTSGGTEADNLAVKGVAGYKGRSQGHILTTCIEHHAVLESCAHMKRLGFDFTELPISRDGIVDVGEAEKAMREDTVLVSVMAANNEIGTIQPIRRIGALAQSRGIPFHTDAVQAIGKMAIDVKRDNIDLLALSGHKFHGPKGIGGHEHGLRSSAENVPGIVGLGKAAEMAKRDFDSTTAMMRGLRDSIIQRVPELVPRAYLNGHRTERLVNNANFRFDFIEGEALMLQLDMKGIAVSTGSACSTGSLEPSHVLMALGLRHEQAHGNLRLTLGRENTYEEVDRFLEVLPGVVSKLRDISPFSEARTMGAGEGGSCVQ